MPLRLRVMRSQAPQIAFTFLLLGKFSRPPPVWKNPGSAPELFSWNRRGNVVIFPIMHERRLSKQGWPNDNGYSLNKNMADDLEGAAGYFPLNNFFSSYIWIVNWISILSYFCWPTYWQFFGGKKPITIDHSERPLRTLMKMAFLGLSVELSNHVFLSSFSHFILTSCAMFSCCFFSIIITNSNHDLIKTKSNQHNVLLWFSKQL